MMENKKIPFFPVIICYLIALASGLINIYLSALAFVSVTVFFTCLSYFTLHNENSG